MAYKLNIVDTANSINANVRYENLARQDRPAITAKVGDKEVKLVSTYQDTILPKGSTKRQYADDEGNFYGTSEVTFYFEGQEVSQVQQTKTFNIIEYQPLKNYTDKYVIATYYELFACNNGMRSDRDRDIAIRGNTIQMRKLWEKLYEGNVVARGEFITTSRGFLASDGYIRAVKFNSVKWGLEIGLFKEEKVFQHLQEGVPTATRHNLSSQQPTRRGVRTI